MSGFASLVTCVLLSLLYVTLAVLRFDVIKKLNCYSYFAEQYYISRGFT